MNCHISDSHSQFARKDRLGRSQPAKCLHPSQPGESSLATAHTELERERSLRRLLSRLRSMSPAERARSLREKSV